MVVSRTHKQSGRQNDGRRCRKVGEVVRHALVLMLEKFHFPQPELARVPLTITEVVVTPDLRQARVFIQPLYAHTQPRGALPDDQLLDEILALLNQRAGYFQKQLGAQMASRYTPRPTFVAETAFQRAQNIEALLHKSATL